jgi:hypothetical protein
MPDNWGYVAAAYAVAAILLGAYWRYLARRAWELDAPSVRRRPGSAPSGIPAGPSRASPLEGRPAEKSALDRSVREPQPRVPETSHPRPEPGSHAPHQ